MTMASVEMREAVLRLRALRQESVRREILKGRRIDLLASHVLGYDVRPIHNDLIDFQEAAPDTCLQLAPRGYGKSTILTIARAVYEILRNPNVRILIAANTQLQAEVFLREIKAHFERNEKLREYFGNFVSEDKWDTREIVVAPRTSTAKESTVTCVGVGGPVASRHYDLIIADDLVDEENARTETQRERVKTWWYQTLLPCCEPDGRIFVIGTRYHHLDLYGHLIRNEYAEKHQIVPAIAADGTTPWPEKFSLEWLEERKRQAGSIIFNAQYQNDTSLMKGHIFRDEWFRFYDVEPNWSEMHHFIGCDPAATKREALISAGTASGAEGDSTRRWPCGRRDRRPDEGLSGGLCGGNAGGEKGAHSAVCRGDRVGRGEERRAVPDKEVPGTERDRCRETIFWCGSGGRIRTCDLWVMSPTSYQTAPPRDNV